MIFDPEKAEKLDCAKCDKALQSLRNCSGTGQPAQVQLNDQLFQQCPRMLYMESAEARYFVKLYLECRETRTYPFLGGMNQQTAFTAHLFEYLDDLFAKQKIKQQKKQTPGI